MVWKIPSYQYCVHVEVTSCEKYLISSRTDISFIFYMHDIIHCYYAKYIKSCTDAGNSESKASSHTQGGATGLYSAFPAISPHRPFCKRKSHLLKAFFFDFPLSEYSSLPVSTGKCQSCLREIVQIWLLSLFDSLVSLTQFSILFYAPFSLDLKYHIGLSAEWGVNSWAMLDTFENFIQSL